MDAPAQYPSAPPGPPGPVPAAIPGDGSGRAEEQPTEKGRQSRHLHGHVPLSPGGTKLSSAVYLSDSHRAMLQALVFRITEGGTWIAITGPEQIGKTVLVQSALTLLPPDKLHIFQVRHSGPGPLSLKSVLSQILDIAEPGAVTSRDLDRANENLFLSSAQGGHAVLLIDDAQDLAADALRYLLALASHPEAAKLHLQVVLAGRPELWTTLQHHEFKPLRDKLALRLTLDRLRPGEDHSYVERRLWVVGTSIRKAITQPALREIVRFGAGVPGNIDQLLDRAAELRRQRGESRITVRTARAAVAALTGVERTRNYLGIWMAGAGTFLVLACAVAFYVLLAPAFQSQGPSSPLPAPSAPATPPQPPSQAAANTATPAQAAPLAKSASAPPEGAAGPTKLADANLAAFDGNQPPPSPPSEAIPSQPGTIAAAPASPQQPPAAAPAPSPPKPAEEVAAPPPNPVPATQQSPEPAAPAPPQPEANQDMPYPSSSAQPQTTKAAEAAPPPAEPTPAGQSPAAPEPVVKAETASSPAEPATTGQTAPESAPKAQAQPQNQPGPVQQQDATPSAPPATRTDETPIEVAAKPLSVPPETRKQPATAPQPQSANEPSASPKLSEDIIAALIRRGDAMLATGDISAARLLYQPAAEAGSGPAAAALGRTFDPAFLTSIGVIGIQPDPTTAAKWYRKAASLGEPGMEDAIKRLDVVPAAANPNSGGR